MIVLRDFAVYSHIFYKLYMRLNMRIIPPYEFVDNVSHVSFSTIKFMYGSISVLMEK